MAGYGRLYPLAKALVTPSTRFLFPTRVTGLDNVCRTGPAIIAPNHISFFGSVALIGVLPRRITYVGKAEYLDSWKTRYVLPAMGMIPIERTGGKRSMEALDTAAGVLERGELFGIFPEGTRSRDGLLHKGRTGLARLAVRCEVHFGRPIDMSRYAGDTVGAATYRSITDEVMYEISLLSGQTYVDRYAYRPPRPEPVSLAMDNAMASAGLQGVAG